MFLSVVIASKGRPNILLSTLESILDQTHPPDEIILVGTQKSDIPQGLASKEKIRVVLSEPGSSVQRNIGIDLTNFNSDLIMFLDDDVELARNYIENITSFLLGNKNVVAVSGTPLLNKPKNGLMSREEAKQILLSSPISRKPPIKQRGLYGCNMTVRAHPARSVKFDERLSLYAWLEDRDFGIRLEKFGDVVDYGGENLIHLAPPSGRMSQFKIGYGQIMNPLYLYRIKNVLTFREFIDHAAKGLVANLLWSFYIFKDRNGIPSSERRKRLRGNFFAIKHCVTNGISPESVKNIIE